MMEDGDGDDSSEKLSLIRHSSSEQNFKWIVSWIVIHGLVAIVGLVLSSAWDFTLGIVMAVMLLFFAMVTVFGVLKREKLFRHQWMKLVALGANVAVLSLLILWIGIRMMAPMPLIEEFPEICGDFANCAVLLREGSTSINMEEGIRAPIANCSLDSLMESFTALTSSPYMRGKVIRTPEPSFVQTRYTTIFGLSIDVVARFVCDDKGYIVELYSVTPLSIDNPKSSADSLKKLASLMAQPGFCEGEPAC